MSKHYIKFLLLLILCQLSLSIYARTLEITSFELLPTDLSARTNKVVDYNGDACALIKVSLPERECRFDGGVVKQTYDISEYLVYVTPGTRTLTLKYSGAETLKIDLAHLLEGQEITSGSTYRLALTGYEDYSGEKPKNDIGANYLILDITPKTGLTVKVDGNRQDVDNGQTMTFLKYGAHDYLIEADGYAPVKGTAVINKSGNTVIEVKLESVAAHLDIKSVTPDVSIKINNKEQAKGNFSCSLNPGLYHIEVSKEGYRPYSTTVELAQNDTKTLQIPELTAITGILNIAYKPIGSTITIDGVNVGTTPAVLNDILVGNHTVTISKDGYETATLTSSIAEGQSASLQGELKEKPSVDINDLYALGVKALKVRNFAEAFKYLNEAAQHGHKEAILETGIFYEHGYDVVEPDLKKAFEIYQAAAQDGLPEGYFRLGYMYYCGKHVKQDYMEALKLFQKGADKGNAQSMRFIGNQYMYGDGVSKNVNEALKWWKKAGDNGETMAYYSIGNHYEHEENLNEALKWYKIGAEKGDETCCNQIAIKYYYGKLGTEDYAEAMRWYRKGADAGGSYCMECVGGLYEKGEGVAQNYAEAVKWYNKAIAAGNPLAKISLGKMYENGLGVTKNLDEAIRLYKEVAAEKFEYTSNKGKEELNRLGVQY